MNPYARLNELAALPVGWFDGEGVPPSETAVRLTRALLEALSPDLHEFVVISPYPEGDLSVCILQRGWSLDAQVHEEGYSIHGLHLPSNRSETAECVTPEEAAREMERFLGL